MDETLPDIPPRNGSVLLVGINPTPISVRAGHYYQGTVGKQLWRRLERVGLLVGAILGREDEAWADAGNGLTDIVKRPTSTAADLTAEELEQGASELGRRIRGWEPGLVLFAFRPPAVRLLGSAVRPGVGPDLDGTPTFLLSGPYAATEERERIDAELQALLGLVDEKPPDAESPSRTPPVGDGEARTQRVTATDIAHGRIRLPRDAKRFFPPARTTVEISLRGERLQVSYDPRTGPDRERSAVLHVGRATLAPRVRPNEILRVSHADGLVSLD